MKTDLKNRNKKRNIKTKEIDVFGDEKMAVRRMTTPKGIVMTVITIYGFVSFLNPERYPILGVLVKNTSYAELARYDSLLGLILFVAGVLIFFRSE
ncbi:MAG: hypothetical protein KAT49_05355 [Methanomicrobia archaeon]|nr:hypothetical protein [Methanomicrobia archaeon]